MSQKLKSSKKLAASMRSKPATASWRKTNALKWPSTPCIRSVKEPSVTTSTMHRCKSAIQWACNVAKQTGMKARLTMSTWPSASPSRWSSPVTNLRSRRPWRASMWSRTKVRPQAKLSWRQKAGEYNNFYVCLNPLITYEKCISKKIRVSKKQTI